MTYHFVINNIKVSQYLKKSSENDEKSHYFVLK